MCVLSLNSQFDNILMLRLDVCVDEPSTSSQETFPLKCTEIKCTHVCNGTSQVNYRVNVWVSEMNVDHIYLSHHYFPADYAQVTEGITITRRFFYIYVLHIFMVPLVTIK